MGRSHTPVSRLNPLSATKSATRTASQTTKAVIKRYDLASVYAFPWASNESRDIPRAVERLPISMPWISSWRAIDGPGIGPRNADGFFQAEDGIRDVAVTGVQTCALPI